MNEFINEFGKENFIIIIAVVVAIIFALVIIVLIEHFQSKRHLKKQMKEQINHYNETIKQQPVETKVSQENEDEEIELFEENKDEEVVYVEEKNPEEEAKEKLEEVTKKLVEDEKNLIDHTNFEIEQEEKSIISYEELVKASHDVDEKNESLLLDEGEEPITLEELYQKHVEDQNVIEEPTPEVKVSNPVFEEPGEKKFKSSEVISPVFGFYNGQMKKEQEEKTPKEVFEELDNTVEMKDLEIEIQKTEEFLSELKKLKNKLD